MRTVSAAPFVTLLCSTLSGQSAPAFDIADVHLSGRAANPYTFVSGGTLRAGRYDLRKATLLDLIRIAYGVEADRVLGGPSWLELDRFDVSAKAPENTPPETIKLMLQALLAERFKLTLHKDTRPLPAFVLKRGKANPKLKEAAIREAAAGEADNGCRSVPQQGVAIESAMSCRGAGMEAFAQALRRMAGDYLPYDVADQTGLQGAWDFDLHWSGRSQVLAAGAGRTTIFNAVQQQLGLDLELGTMPAPVIVVDRANETPTPNRPDVAQLLPPRPIEFEVADLKPSAPDEKDGGYRVSPGGRLEIRNLSMRVLLGMAFDVDWDHVDDVIFGAPKWIDSRKFDIVAKPAPSSDGPPGFGFVPDDDTRLMLRALLVDRFRMKVRYEERTIPAYTLVAIKPKLKKAQPSVRSSCKEAKVVADDPRDRNPRLSELLICHNMSMAQFATQLQPLSPYDFATPVEDATGISGAFDFTLNYTPTWQMNTGSTAQANNGAASDPNGAMSIFEAVSKQLGLKLKQDKRPVPVVIIDHMEDKPTEN